MFPLKEFFFNIDLFWRDRTWAVEGQRERETQNQKQAPGSEPSAQSPTRGPNSRTTRSWPGWSRTLNRLRHPGAPERIFFNIDLFWRDRERQNMSSGGAEREGDAELEPGSRLRALGTKPDVGLEPMNHEIMSWAEVRRLTHWATQVPLHFFFFKCFCIFKLFCVYCFGN